MQISTTSRSTGPSRGSKTGNKPSSITLFDANSTSDVSPHILVNDSPVSVMILGLADGQYADFEISPDGVNWMQWFIHGIQIRLSSVNNFAILPTKLQFRLRLIDVAPGVPIATYWPFSMAHDFAAMTPLFPPQGDPRRWLPIGGNTDQVLAKASNSDYDVTWRNSLVYWTEGINDVAPNDIIPVLFFFEAGGFADIDVALPPVGDGSFLLAFPDNTAFGGNKRGARSVDLQRLRGDPAMVASGPASVITGGEDNEGSGDHSFIGGGTGNTASGDNAAVPGGANNNASGEHSVIAGGENNVASGDHSANGGGSGNFVTGDDSFVGGGENNVCSGDDAFIGGGVQNVASNIRSVVGGGVLNQANGAAATVAGGDSNLADALGSTVGGGVGNQANRVYATIPGGAGAVVEIPGQFAYSSRYRETVGDAQLGEFTLTRKTLDATPTQLTLDGNAPGPTNSLIIPGGATARSWAFDGLLVARQLPAEGTKRASIKFQGSLNRDVDGGIAATLDASTVTDIFNPDGWVLTPTVVVAGPGLCELVFTVTGQAATTIHWVIRLRTVECFI